jgi:hypothetical protein
MRLGPTSLGPVALAGSAMILAACAASTDQAPPQMELPEGLSPEVYLPPMPPVAEGGAILSGCPNPAGLDRLEGVTDEDAVSLLDQLWSEDADQARRASDPGFWPVLGDVSPREADPQPGWLVGPVRPASESPYAGSLTQQCGETLVQAAWAFTVCPPGCKAQSSSSLEEDYFLISRSGQLLIWAVWP